MIKRIYSYIIDSVETIVFVLSLYIVVYIFFFMPSEVRGSSMEPTLHTKERLIINKFIYRFREVERGDIVVLQSPHNPDVDYIKRVIGLPGDKIRIENGRVYVNNEIIPDLFTTAETRLWEGGRFEEGKTYPVPAESLFVLGDNRPRSSDSREFGFVPLDSIVGKAVLRFYPPEKFGFIENPLSDD